MDAVPVRVVRDEDGTSYVEVNAFVDLIINDLRKTPPDMVSSRDEIIQALRNYAAAASSAMEEQ